jgi:uncharacterized protein (DUF3084 family)
MDSSTDHATEPDFGEAAAGRLPVDGARAVDVVAQCDLVTMGVGAVMAMHSVDRATAMTALRRAADQFQVPVAAVAHAVLTLVAGTGEESGITAGRAAAQLLVEGFTGRERDAEARDRAADRRDDIAADREEILDGWEAEVQALLAAADVRDRLAGERDRRADERDLAAERRPFTSEEEYKAAALDRGLAAIDRFNAGVDRDHSAGDRAELMRLPRVPLLRPLGDDA